ncbi:MAG: hypothetical protein AB1640_25575 [bacterium]
MATRTHEMGFTPFTQETHSRESDSAAGLIEELRDSFAQVNIAADFLLLETDPARSSPQLQLACLIKERIARIQEQVQRLYCSLNDC